MNGKEAQCLIKKCIESYRRNPTPDTLGRCFKNINEYCNFEESLCNVISRVFVHQID